MTGKSFSFNRGRLGNQCFIHTSWAFGVHGRPGCGRFDIFNKKFTTIADFIEVDKAELVQKLRPISKVDSMK